jgi:phage/plasmid-associated DNA primase
MKLIEYFNEHNILWQPLELRAGKVSNKEPQYNSVGKYMPKSSDFKLLDKNIIIERQKTQTKYFDFGAVDLRQVHHIDVDFKKDGNYSQESVKFVQDCKNNYPYFLSSTKQLPHFLFKGDCGKKERIQTKYKDIEILNLGWSFFRLDDQIINVDIDIPEINIFRILCNEIDLVNGSEKNVVVPKIQKIQNKNNNFHEIDIDPMVLKLLNCINNDGEGKHYDDYTKIIWSLKNDNLNNYDVALDFSKRSSKHDDSYFNKLWSEGRNGNTLGTVHYYAHFDNPKKYRCLIPQDEIKPTEESLSNLFMKLEAENLVYSNENVYIYEKEWMIDCSKKYKLKKLIRTTLNKFIVNKLQDNIESESSQEYFNKIHQRICMRKTIDNVCEYVIQDLASIGKEIEFNTGVEQHFNLHFNNGCYDLKKKQFRQRTKADYITTYLDWDYDDNISDSSMAEVNLFFKKLHVDKEQRDFSISWLASCLDGNLGKNKFKMNIGYSAENGKSTEFAIHEKVFPIYYKKLSANLFNLDNGKRHKEIINLMNNPIRMACIEELKTKKLDGDFLKEFCDGKLACEIMYGTSVTKSIQATLHTCANKDFNMDVDAGILRRGVMQSYKSQFKKEFTKDNWERREFVRDNNFKDKFDCDEMKNAYLQLLLKYYSTEISIPKSNENLFKSTALEYDEIGEIIFKHFECTKDPNDLLHKDIVHLTINSYKKLTWRKCLQEMKTKGFEYDRLKKRSCKRGFFIGIRLIVDSGDDVVEDDEDFEQD